MFVLVNSRKVFMHKIYYNLTLELQTYTNVNLSYLEDLRARSVCNYEASGCLEPACVMMVLT